MSKKKTKTRKLLEKTDPSILNEQCSRCMPAKCCTYFSLEIDRPRSKKDYDDLLWFLAHENISLYIWEKDWYLMINNRCNFLSKKTNLCEIYDHRPRICREHLLEDCEFDSDYEFDEHFKSYNDLKRWLEKKRRKK